MADINIQVCYALPDTTAMLALTLPAGSTIKQAIDSSGVLARFPEIDLSVQKVGVFGKLKPLDAGLHEGDRVEIYRALQADPMESRRRRARHKA
jgi:putative ubiquitin-RnfH superfamily antitoxin RatB of RatAB toxin-antitoxin module